MLARENRLKKKKDFEKVFKQGQGYKEDFLRLKIAKNNLKNSRFGFVISKKVSAKAVVRNKIRRRLKSLVNSKIAKIEKGIDGTIVVMPGFKIDDYWEMENNINNLFKKANILK